MINTINNPVSINSSTISGKLRDKRKNVEASNVTIKATNVSGDIIIT